jgi:multiple sugar transport system substrate-binding protein
MKKAFLFLALLALPALIFAGGQKSASGNANYLRFAWWGGTTRAERTNAVIKLFEQKNPGVTVEPETTSWDNYWVKLNTQVASRSLPDIMQQDLAYIVMYNNQNLLVDMDQFTKSGAIDLSKWPQDAVSSGRLNGKLIALNLGTNTWGVGADLGALQKAGVSIDDTKWTWKDFEQMAITIYQRTGVQTLPFTEWDQIPEHIVRQFGSPMYSADGKSLAFANNAAAVAAVKEVFLDMMLRLKAAGALYDPEDAFIPEREFEDLPITHGKTWNNWHWSNEHIGLKEAAGRDLGYFLSPSVNGNKAPYGTYLQPSQFISMVSSSTKKDLAAKFVNFFVNDLEANRILMAERGIPLPTDVRADLASRVTPDMKYMFDFVTRVTPYCSPIDPPKPEATEEVWDMTRGIILQCFLGQISSDAAMAQLIRTTNDVLKQ